MTFTASPTTNDDGNYEWWEKSVEYLFVAKAITQDWVDLFCPLAGTPEKGLGDLILQADSRLFLIEFKVDRTACKSERKKYENYQDSAKLLKSLPGSKSHALIYGYVDRKPPGKARNAALNLKMEHYWPPTEVIKIESSPWGHLTPVSNKEFRDYVRKLSKTRDVIEVIDGTSSGSTGTRSVSMTVAVLKSGKTVALSLPEYKKLKPTPPAPQANISSVPKASI